MPKSFFQKFIVCFLAGLLSAMAIVRIGWRFLYPWIPNRPMLFISLIILIAALVYPIVWNRKKEPQAGGAERIYSFWIGVIRYSVALNLIMVGMQKWFYLQFNTPIAKLDLPFSSFSSEDLVWAFFGHSHGFVLVIGSLQIIGSLFLLYNRTRLFGTVLLIPVMLNILLIDLFYGFYFGERFNAFVLLVALVYLLLLDYEKLVTVFFARKNAYPAMVFKSKWLKNGVRLSACCIPLAMIWINPNPYRHPWFSGKYHVDHFSVNDHPLTAGLCTDSVLTVIYFDQGNECVFEYNSQERRLFGTYRYDQSNNKMTIVWHYPKNMHDTLQTTLSVAKPESDLVLSGKMGNEIVQASLRKVNP